MAPVLIVLRRLYEFRQIERIYLFGSRARGDAGPRSDIDLAIACPLAGPIIWADICQTIDAADTLLKIDAIRLEEALAEPQSNPLAVDGAIQRFEFVFELNWKTLRQMLEAEGITVNTPRAVIRETYKAQWIDNETAWLQMLSDRNDTSRTYNADLARRIYAHIRGNFPVLAGTAAALRARVNAASGGA